MAVPCFGWDETRFPWGNREPGEVPDTVLSSFRWRYPGFFLASTSNPVCKSFTNRQGSEQARPEGQTFRQPPRGFCQTGNRGARPAQLSGSARAGRRLSSFVSIYSEDPRIKQTCTQVQVLCPAIFSLGPSTARSLFVKNKKRMGGGLPSHHHG